MSLLILSLFFLLFPLSNCCLVINFPITTTPPVKCSCPYLQLDTSNLQQFAGNSPIYRNITSYHITTPSISSTDNCSLTVECSADYSLVVFDTEGYAFFGNRELPGFCDPYTQKWTLDDGIGELRTFSRIDATCVNYNKPPDPECPCTDIGRLTEENRALYDPNGKMKGRILDVKISQSPSPPTCVYQSFTCDYIGWQIYVYYDGVEAPVEAFPMSLSCGYPSANETAAWNSPYGWIRNPLVACVSFF